MTQLNTSLKVILIVATFDYPSSSTSIYVWDAKTSVGWQKVWFLRLTATIQHKLAVKETILWSNFGSRSQNKYELFPLCLLLSVSEICFHPTRVMYIALCAAEAECSFKQFYELGLRWNATLNFFNTKGKIALLSLLFYFCFHHFTHC